MSTQLPAAQNVAVGGSKRESRGSGYSPCARVCVTGLAAVRLPPGKR